MFSSPGFRLGRPSPRKDNRQFSTRAEQAFALEAPSLGFAGTPSRIDARSTSSRRGVGSRRGSVAFWAAFPPFPQTPRSALGLNVSYVFVVAGPLALSPAAPADWCRQENGSNFSYQSAKTKSSDDPAGRLQRLSSGCDQRRETANFLHRGRWARLATPPAFRRNDAALCWPQSDDACTTNISTHC